MNFTTYIRRTAKYAIYLAIFLIIILFVMSLVDGTKQIPLSEMICSQRGLMLLGAMLFFSALHPFLGYTKKTLICNAEKRKEDVQNVMTMCGYKLSSEQENKMTFRAATKAKRILLLCEDTITIETSEVGTSTMQGPRKEVVRASFRVGSFVQ